MNKRILGWVVSVLLIGVAVFSVYLYLTPKDYSPPPTEKEFRQTFDRIQRTPLREVDVAKPLDPSHAVRVAIGSLGFSDENQSRNIADLVVANLTGERGVEMVEREQLNAALHEMHLSLSGLVRASEAIRVGKFLRADWFLLGTPTRIGGTNFIVVRIVDARTGILQDGCGLAIDQSPLDLSKKLADFVRQCRQLATTGSSRVYLAIGTFQDLSPNSHAAALPRQLRSYLMSAYQRSSVTLLEREFVSTLLNEVHLDLAGLTEGGGTNAPSPMQAAYWIVDGYYQSYETTNRQVELVLGVQRVFGNYHEIALRDEPGEPLFHRVNAAVDLTMNQDKSRVAVSRVSELRAQITAGKQLARLDWGDGTPIPISDLTHHVYISRYQDLPPNEWARRRRNTEEAMRAFQTALLLDPTNREAKICLASCLRQSYFQRDEEARDIYREIIETGVQDHWDDIARQALIASFEGQGADAKLRFLENAVQTASNTVAVDFYRAWMKSASEEAVLEKQGTPEAETLAEKRLFDDMKRWDGQLNHPSGGIDFYNTGLGKYTESFGTNSAEAASRLVKLLPRLQAMSPNLAPYLLAGVTSFQVDTNAAIIREFSNSLVRCSLHPEQVVSSTYYFNMISTLSYWCIDGKLYGLMAQLFEAREAAARKGYADPLDDHDKLSLGYAYMDSDQWGKALVLFESYSNRPVYMGNRGLWGEAFSEVLPSKQAALCHQKLGLPPNQDPRELKFDPQPFSFRSSLAFACDDSGLWIATDGQLLHLNFDFQTNLSFTLPSSFLSRVTTICVGPSNVWVGTSDTGIIEFNKSTREFRQFTERDGLLMNSVSCLHLDGRTLWVGYGNQRSGGFGSLDIKSHAIRSFTPSLTGIQSSGCQPPGAAVSDIVTSNNGDPWLNVGGRQYNYSVASNSWGIVPAAGSVGCIVIDHDRLLAGLSSTLLASFSIPACSRETEIPIETLPHPLSTLTCNGDKIWAGGEGFIAALDATTGKITKLGFVPWRSVSHLEIAGGFVWASFNGDNLSGYSGEICRAALMN